MYYTKNGSQTLTANAESALQRVPAGISHIQHDVKDKLANWRMINDGVRFEEEKPFSHCSLDGIAWWKCRIPNEAVLFAFPMNYFAGH